MFATETELPNRAPFAAAERAPAWNRWEDSTLELQRGLDVIEHHWSPDEGCDALLELVSFV